MTPLRQRMIEDMQLSRQAGIARSIREDAEVLYAGCVFWPIG